MIALLDLGVGNLKSAEGGFARVGATTTRVADGEAFARLTREAAVEGVVLPGVGAFGDAMFQLRTRELWPVIRQVVKEGIPLFGICLGMQLLFGRSEEHGAHVGLGLLRGHVVRFRDASDKIPHMGWNSLNFILPHPLLQGIQVGDFVYFVHSYHAVVEESQSLLASSDYASVAVPAVVGTGHVFGAQFHPEKSGVVGEQILHNFITYCSTMARRKVEMS